MFVKCKVMKKVDVLYESLKCLSRRINLNLNLCIAQYSCPTKL